MKLPTQPLSLLGQFERLSISSNPLRPSSILPRQIIPSIRTFSSTTSLGGNWLQPSVPEAKRSRKGRPRVPTGGSSRGTTVVWGDYGIRMLDHHRRISAAQLKNGEEVIKQRLRGMRYRLYKRVSASIGVYSSGNEVRMGKGKGSFDHWASRVAVSKIIFEVRGEIHEKIIRDAFRLAGNKMPGTYEFVKKGDPAVVGITKLDGVTLEQLKRPRRAIPLDALPTQPAEGIQTTVSTTTSPTA